MMASRARHALQTLLEDRVKFDVPMSRKTSLRVGGPADALATPRNREEMVALLELCRQHHLPRTWLGAGFNLLIQENGLDGVVVCTKKLRRLEARPGPTVFAECGVSHASLTRFCVEHGLAGLEFGAGIPGTIGGWMAMNAGIGDREQKDVVLEVETLSAETSETQILRREALGFGYRSCAGLEQGAVALSTLFEVTAADPGQVKAEVDRLLGARQTSQPLDVPSCGSVFRNPEGDYAGRLIEQAGLCGERLGGAEISRRHANFIVNRGGATADDVLGLIDRARRAVRTMAGIELQTEVRILGRMSE
ncbi:MAG: UDP-N-acetylenolpyruvoylglucosamine reductase [bacterium TMED88]|nr:UDP-N-acetylenolpyruvoylglucosamine reductase [Deltaproteobacteria bacterium]OUV24882.1 MAG: UDP-N-acetylenolpyruvoylglucosamine reductase [bacterium TMED88]